MDNFLIYSRIYNKKILMHIDNDIVEHICVIPDDTYAPIGSIWSGRVTKMIPSSGACFIDIGDVCEYFVKIPDNIEDITFADGKTHSKIHPEDIIVVQVSSEAVKQKAPSATTNIAIPGVYSVISTGSGISYSQKLSKQDRKKIILPKNTEEIVTDIHITIRTEAKTLTNFDILCDEMCSLSQKLRDIIDKASHSTYKSKLYTPESFLQKQIINYLKYNFENITVEDDELYNELLALFENDSLDLFKSKIRLYKDEMLSLNKLYRLESRVDELISKKVYLKSGAFLIIEQGETLTAIDVNSGHAISGSKEETALKINIEAAEEIGRILRTRNISGMILIDYINMKNPAHTGEVIRATQDSIRFDEVPTKYVDLTGLGLIELTRKRIYKSFAEQMR